MGRTVRRMMLVALLALVTALRLSSASIPNNTNDLMAAAVPISYGESLFRQRILAQTEGERDPVGLVLSGGSARAFAHIGVLQYLEEQGIVPDFIISNSMGSIVGILYAAGLSPDQILSIITEVDITQLFDLSIPLAGGVLDISRFLSLVASHLGESLRIEELPIPIMIVCEDLATKRQARIMEGDMLTGMGAAVALPVYFPPGEYNGHMLVD
ncbi:MAG: patatin-like phospholipase family protein, partial [Sphaerochaetaceae bacterium]|nr:patatin-like phospholipase family protein [Sphaerochaetaceae bacterium]